MPHGYCTDCDARVTVINDGCLLGHTINPATLSSKRGRRIANGVEAPIRTSGSVALLDRPLIRRADHREPEHRDSHRPTSGINLALPGARDRAEAAGINLPPVHSMATGADDLNPTGDFVIQLWDETGDGPPLENWQTPDGLDMAPDRSPIRMVAILLLIGAVAALGMSVALIFGSATSERENLAIAATDLEASIASFDPIAVDLDLSQLDGAARSVLAAAEALEVGDPERAVAIDAAGRVIDVARTQSEARSYQTGFLVFVGRPSLPVAATQAQLSEISADYTAWVTALSGVLASAPTDRAFEQHRSTIEEFAAELPTLQANYLDGLRAGESAGATESIQHLDERVTALENSLADAVTATHVSFEAIGAEIEGMLSRLTSDR